MQLGDQLSRFFPTLTKSVDLCIQPSLLSSEWECVHKRDTPGPQSWGKRSQDSLAAHWAQPRVCELLGTWKPHHSYPCTLAAVRLPWACYSRGGKAGDLGHWPSTAAHAGWWRKVRAGENGCSGARQVPEPCVADLTKSDWSVDRGADKSWVQGLGGRGGRGPSWNRWNKGSRGAG